MKTPLVWLNLVHRKGRSLAAAAGVACVVVFCFLLPYLGGTAEAPAGVNDALNFDLLLVSSQFVDFSHPGSVPRSVTSLMAGVPGVRAVMPLHIGSALWRNSDSGRARPSRPVTTIGFDLDEPVFRRGGQVAAAIARFREELQKPDRVLLDQLSGHTNRGAEIYLGERRVTVVGPFTLGTGMDVVLCSDVTLSLILGEAAPDRMSMGLVLLKQGASTGRVAAALRNVLPTDVRVLTRREATARERPRQAGVPFPLGILAVVAGLALAYQAIVSSVRSQLPEFATLLALGYATRYLSGVLVAQVLLLAAAGYAAGLGAVAALGAVGFPLEITWQRGLVALAPSAVCSLPGLRAVRQLWTTDPADLLDNEAS
jgi:putative ABC transport system permease protein